jgi:hypothetical protein
VRYNQDEQKKEDKMGGASDSQGEKENPEGKIPIRRPRRK